MRTSRSTAVPFSRAVPPHLGAIPTLIRPMHTEDEQKTEHFGDLPSFVIGRESELVAEYATTTKSETVLLKSAQ